MAADKQINQEEAVQLLASRLAAGSLADKTATVHVLPSTSNPAAFGLFGLAVCNCLHMGPFLKITDNGADQLMYSFALLFGGLGQMLAGWLEFQRKNTWACVTWLCYSGYWMGFGLSGILEGAEILTPSPEGWQMANALWGVLTFILWMTTFAFNGALCLMMFLLTIQFFLEAASATHPSCWRATGVFGFLVSILAFYIGASVLCQEVYHKDVLPLFPLDWTKLRGNRRFGATGTRKDLAPKIDSEEEV